ncbi:MAG TPA: histidinol-phosphate transaminase [Vicinamibacteria bacterium]|nr:histidinol-phosphate transaminase [Vicinamibacteria bacterium]
MKNATEAAQTAERVLRHIKPAVRAVAAYTLSARRAPVKLNQNENPYDVPESLKRKVTEQALRRPWSRYPDFDPQELLEALARFSGWRADGILAGNGSNELIEALLLVTVGEGTRVVIPEPTFTLYALLTGILGGRAVRVPLGEDFEYDASALSRARREAGAPLTIVCSPNNPTGGVLAGGDLRRLCAESDGLVVVDEAYHEFSRQSAVPLLSEHPNLIVLRTFSKAMGVAGLRLGYLLASPAIVAEVNKARLPYNLNFFSQAAALAVLDEAPVFGEAVGRLIAMRDRLALDLAALPGVRVFPSRANFLLFALAEADPRRVFEDLYARGVLVRDVSAYPRLRRCLRVTVGGEEENAAFLGALRASLGAS